MEFYKLKEVNEMANNFVRRKELHPRLNILEDAKKYVKICQNIIDAENNLKIHLDTVFLNNQKYLTRIKFKIKLIELKELTDDLLNNIVNYNYDFKLNHNYDFEIDINTKEEAIDIYKKYIYETHSIDGTLNKLYRLSATLNNLTILYLEEFYDMKFNDKFVDSLSDKTKEKFFFNDINKDDINELYKSFNEKILIALEITES